MSMLNGKNFTDDEEKMVEIGSSNLPTFVQHPIYAHHKKVRFVEVNPDFIPQQIWHNNTGLKDTSEISSSLLKHSDCVKLYPVMKRCREGKRISSSDSDSVGHESEGYITGPQVMIDFGAVLPNVEEYPASTPSLNKQIVTFATASSSNIGNLSIHDDIAEVEKIDHSNQPKEELTILAITKKKETSPENFVSSTSGILHPLTRGENVKPMTYFEHFQDLGDILSFSTMVSTPPNASETPQIGNEDNSKEVQPSSGTVGKVQEGKCPSEPNGNISLGGRDCQTGVEVDEEEDEEDLGGGEDDDSSGIILKDETDTAEEDAESENENEKGELTDSASEAEGMHDEPKPIITISDSQDQQLPRLVIDFGTIVPSEILSEKNKIGEEHNETSDQYTNYKGNDSNSGNNNSILDFNSIPIQTWIESAQRFNKRKRTDSERLDEK